MGIYVNPGNDGFQRIRNSEYVDKSGLIDMINQSLDTTDNMICFSRPRRFGKSFAAQMLCAYYDKSCDSHHLFDDLEIAQQGSYETYLNRYIVLSLDITWFISVSERLSDVVTQLQIRVIQELRSTFPGCIPPEETALGGAMLAVAKATGDRFYVVIDEWDALFREAKHDEALQRAYLQLLRGLFKSIGITEQMIAGAYMTGILPIKKYGTESALTNFQEFTMAEPGHLSPYIGFTEAEVEALCNKHDLSMDGMKQWYDGYRLGDTSHVYSPNSVMRAVRNRKFGSYWTKTETYESLLSYISLNMDGLQDDIIAMLGGQNVPIDILSFQNDLVCLDTSDDVLTLLIHLGYLAYDETDQTVYIPNLEVSDSMKLAVQRTGWSYVAKALADSRALLTDTLAGHAEAVASALDNVHMSASSILQYNDENSLSCALTIAYYAARSDYMIVRELPTGKGFADLAFIPRNPARMPAMILELKYDHDADSAIRQIRERRYGGELKDYAGRLILVAISYDRKTKRHSCVIENG